MRLYFAYQHNKADAPDDNVLKIRATSKARAKEVASIHTRSNFRLGHVYTREQFKRCYPEWHILLWDVKAITEEGNSI